MYQPLVPCPSCERHVRVSERACPFCDAALAGSELTARVIPSAPARLSRAAAFVFGTTLAVAGCAEMVGATDAAVDVAGDGRVRDDGGISPLYGDPIPPDAAPVTDATPPPEDGSPPPSDAAPVRCDDGGAPATMYGGPFLPPCDAGPLDGGGGGADYGAPPPRDN